VPGHVRALLGAADFRLFLLVSFLGQAAQSSYDLCYSLHLRDLGVPGSIVGAAWAIGVVAEVALMGWGAPLLARAPPPRLLLIAFGGAAIRWLLVASVRSPAAQLGLQPLHALSFGLMWLASLAYTKDRVSPHILATAQGLFTTSMSAGSVVGMLVWGALYRRSGGGATFGTAAVVSACACACATVFGRAVARRA
jgi:PPP family 3-phenylpropionic acid transporter